MQLSFPSRARALFAFLLFLAEPVAASRQLRKSCRKALSKAAILALIWVKDVFLLDKRLAEACLSLRQCSFSLPVTRFYVRHILKRTALFAYQEDASWLGVNVQTYTTFFFILGVRDQSRLSACVCVEKKNPTLTLLLF
jgi:hypothetical protein